MVEWCRNGVESAVGLLSWTVLNQRRHRASFPGHLRAQRRSYRRTRQPSRSRRSRAPDIVDRLKTAGGIVCPPMIFSFP